MNFRLGVPDRLYGATRTALHIIGGLIVVANAGFVTLVLMDDPLDSQEIKEALAEAGSGRHALLYEYIHAESSGRGTTVWITSDTPPAIGSRDGPQGDAALT